MPLRRDIPMVVTIRSIVETDVQLGDLPLLVAGAEPTRLEFNAMMERVANRSWDSIKNAVTGNVIELVILVNHDGSPATAESATEAADKAAADKAAAEKAEAEKAEADKLAAEQAAAKIAADEAAAKAEADKLAADEAKAAKATKAATTKVTAKDE